jgi:hypothetical protein
MLFITTQPDTDYYIWQLQVQLNNFKKFGCEDKCIVIFGYNPAFGISPNAVEFAKKTKAKVLYFPDTRDLSTRLYVPSIRPHLLKKLYKRNPEMILNKNFLYLDCDIVFADYPDFSRMNEEKFVHLCNTESLFSFEKLMRSNKELFEKMCKVVGITPYVVNKYFETAGGIAYAFKFFHYFDHDFWDKVERDSVGLYKIMLVSNNEDSLMQIMSANKWALLWNLWLIGYDTKISTELSTSWASDPIENWGKHNLHNNAGVKSEDRGFLFYKGDFDEKTPFEDDFTYVSSEYCSSKYVEEILSTKRALKWYD